MNLEVPHRSATVYQFPAGGRDRQKLAENDAERLARDVRQARSCGAIAKTGWYHEAAVLEDGHDDEVPDGWR